MNDVRILMCGSRTWADGALIFGELARLQSRYGNRLVVVHGDEPNGADVKIYNACETLEIRHEMYCAGPPRRTSHERLKIEQVSDWNKDGLRAGPKRNRYMFDTGINGAVAFRAPGISRGTDGMCEIVLSGHKPLVIKHLDGSTFVLRDNRNQPDS